MTHCSDIIEKLKLQKELVQSGKEDFMNQVKEVELQFTSLLLYYCFGENVLMQILGVFSLFSNHIDSQIKLCKIIDMYLESQGTALSNTNLEICFLQYSLLWLKANNFDLRYHAIKLLFHLLQNPDNKNHIGQQLIKSIETDNVYIKSLIINEIRKKSLLDIATQDYILSRCKSDANYVVRRKATEFDAGDKVVSASPKVQS